MTANLDNLILFYLVLAAYGLGLAIVVHAALAYRQHKPKRRDH